MTNQSKQRLLSIIILLIVCLPPITAFAHDAVFLQVVIDKNSMTYVGNVIADKNGTAQSGHIEARLGDFSNIKITDMSKGIITGDSKVAETEGADPSKADGLNGMVFTFPFIEVKDFTKHAFWGEKNNATRADTERALMVSNLLVPSLNEALHILNDGKTYSSVNSLMKMSQAMRVEGKIKGTQYSIHYGTYEGTKMDKADLSKDYDYDPETGYCYATIYKGNNLVSATEKYRFIYLVPKGYVPPDLPGYSSKTEKEKMHVAPLAFSGIDYSKVQAQKTSGNYDSDITGKNSFVTDTTYLSWHQLAIQANYAYASQGYSSEYTGEFREPNFIEQGIVDFLDNTFNGLRSMLGLYSTEELIYNQGTRSAFVYGTMSRQWNKTVVEYHLLFQAIAWLILSFAIAKAIVMKNMSTISPTMRVDTVEFIQNLLISGFLLPNIFPVIYMLMELNTQLVDVFASQINNLGSTTSMHTMYSSFIAGMIMTVFYFFIDLYMNFTYIMRGLTIALLLASAPLFVVALAFGGRLKELFVTWAKEMVANIFLQSFHAFCFAFFSAIQSKTRGIEGFVVLSAMIPMTEFFRSLVTGNQGAFTQNFGSNTLGKVTSMVSGAMSPKPERKVAGGKAGEGTGGYIDGEGAGNFKSFNGGGDDGGGSAGGAVANSKVTKAFKSVGNFAMNSSRAIGGLGAGIASGDDKMFKTAIQSAKNATADVGLGTKSLAQKGVSYLDRVGSKDIIGNDRAKAQEVQKIMEHDMSAVQNVNSSTKPIYPSKNEAFADTQYPQFQERVYNTDYMQENYPSDYKNISDMQQVFAGEDEIKKTQYRKAGIKGAKSHKEGKFISVQYDNTVADHLGKNGRSINVQQIQQAQNKQQQAPGRKLASQKTSQKERPRARNYPRGMENAVQL